VFIYETTIVPELVTPCASGVDNNPAYAVEMLCTVQLRRRYSPAKAKWVRHLSARFTKVRTKLPQSVQRQVSDDPCDSSFLRTDRKTLPSEAVAIATPVSTDYDVALLALPDKHTLGERPLGSHTDQVGHLIKVAQKRNRVSMADWARSTVSTQSAYSRHDGHRLMDRGAAS
jgi:hypothetical protein